MYVCPILTRLRFRKLCCRTLLRSEHPLLQLMLHPRRLFGEGEGLIEVHHICMASPYLPCRMRRSRRRIKRLRRKKKTSKSKKDKKSKKDERGNKKKGKTGKKVDDEESNESEDPEISAKKKLQEAVKEGKKAGFEV